MQPDLEGPQRELRRELSQKSDRRSYLGDLLLLIQM